MNAPGALESLPRTPPRERACRALVILAALGLLAACGDTVGRDGDSAPAPADAGVATVGDGVADAGPDQDVTREFEVTLDGTASHDPDGAPLTYRWTQVAGPDVTRGEGFLSGAAPAFAAPSTVGTLVFSLTVDDGSGPGLPDVVLINVLEDASAAFFVDGDAGDDEAGNGTRELPWATVERALSALSASREDLYLRTRAGDAPYDLTAGTLALPTGTSLYGGYGDAWVRDAAGSPTTIDGAPVAIALEPVDLDVWVSGLRILGASTDDAARDVAPVWADGGSARLTVEDCELTAGDVLGGEADRPGSSFGMFVEGVRLVTVRRSVLTAGEGGRGASGATGQVGATGDGGSNASGNGRASGGSGGPGGDGGAGGRRGRGLFYGNGGGGSRGYDADGTQNGGSGGSGGSGNDRDHGGPGGDAPRGGDGEAGDGAWGGGGVDEDGRFQPARGASGSTGGHGRGGGGGGGGEANRSGYVGGGGGGGGEGGGGGTGGSGGAGGGASVGLWLVGADEAEVEACVITATTGGEGGRGGEGGAGGPGGRRGTGAAGDCGSPCLNRAGPGGHGGDGGDGGKGGSGGGGGGGPSFGVFVGPGVAPTLSECDISAGAGGEGGRGGPDDGRGGDGGFAFALYDADLEDGAVPSVVGGTLTAGDPGASGAGTGDGSPGAAGETGRRNVTEGQ